jgi:hypothetical protein
VRRGWSEVISPWRSWFESFLVLFFKKEQEALLFAKRSKNSHS